MRGEPNRLEITDAPLKEHPERKVVAPSPWSAVAKGVLRIIRVHPLLEPLRTAARNEVDGPGVWCHADAIGVYFWFLGAGERQFRVEARRPRWWVPRNGSEGELVERIADHLAAKLLEAWENRGELR